MPGLARLALANGLVFKGISIGISGTTVSELIFNTAMTGYQEILTDPSYAGQIVTFTHPHIGNTGINDEDMESDRAWLAGLVIRNISRLASNYRSQRSLGDFLQEQNVLGIAEVDTRAITNLLRTEGAIGAALLAGDEAAGITDNEAVEMASAFGGLEGQDLTTRTSTQKTLNWTQRSWVWPQRPDEDTNNHRGAIETASDTPLRVVALDFGIKRNILRLLRDQGCEITVVPSDTSVKAILAQAPDGIFLSNGPGDPAACTDAIKRIKQLLETGIPMFGICLGHQMIALACGAKTAKMMFGHHGANHPIKDLETAQVLISSQNHGFTVSEESLDDFEVTHRSLFDHTIQGLAHKKWPLFGFQGHPEASPGPHEASALFQRFIESGRHYQSQRRQQDEPSSPS